MYLKKLLLLLMLFAWGFSTLAQTQQINGKVLSSDNHNPLQGVTVKLKEIGKNTITDKEGKFSISAKKGATLIFSHVGYEDMEIAVKDNASLTIVLIAKFSKLDQVVVVGYGSTKKRDLTGSIAKVDYGTRVNTTVTPTFEAGLQGRALGVQVVQANGTPGAAVRIRVRGQNSFNGSGDPLYVVDGMPIYSGNFSNSDGSVNNVSANNGNVLSTINPGDIESVEILKDAASSAIYGARGANGVVVITTKRGKTGDTKFNFTYSSGQPKVIHKLDLISAQDWWKLYNEARVNDGSLPIDPNTQITINSVPFKYNDIKDVNTDWISETLRTGKIKNAVLSAQGGNEKTQFFVGGGYKKEEGILKENDYTQINGRVNIDNQATKNLKFGIQSSITYTDNDQVPTSFSGGIGAAQSTALRIFPIYNADGTFFGTQFTSPTTGANPVARLLNKYKTKTNRVMNNLYGDVKISKDLSFRVEYGIDLLDQLEERYDDKTNRYFAPGGGFPTIGLAARWERRLSIVNMNGNAYFTFNKSFAEKHKIAVTLGSSIQDSKTKAIGISPASGGVGFVNNYFDETVRNMAFAPGATPAGSAVSGYNERDSYRFLSFFGRANYKLSDKYLVGASFRADGSSRFGSNHRFGYFPAISAGWIISNEKFLFANPTINYLKLRSSYGYTGNSEIGNFQYLGTFSSTGGYLGFTGITPTRLPNPDLTWEKARQFDASVEFGILNNKISGSIGFYRKISTDALLAVPAQISATGIGSILINSKDVVVRNSGLELELTFKIINKENFSWSTELNVAANRNKVLETGNIPPDGFGNGAGDTRVVKGYPIGISYLAHSAGVNPQTGNEMVYKLDGTIIDALKQTDITDNRQPAGNPFPDFFGGINNILHYKNFELDFLFSFSEGSKIYNDDAKRQMGGFIGQSWNLRTEVLNRWQQPGDITDIPRLTIKGNSFTGSDRNTTRFLFDNSFVRLRSINLSYTLPKSITTKMKIASVKIFLSGNNLLTFTKFKGWDPEVIRYASSAGESNVGFDAPYLPTPQAKTLIFGINIGF